MVHLSEAERARWEQVGLALSGGSSPSNGATLALSDKLDRFIQAIDSWKESLSSGGSLPRAELDKIHHSLEILEAKLDKLTSPSAPLPRPLPSASGLASANPIFSGSSNYLSPGTPVIRQVAVAAEAPVTKSIIPLVASQNQSISQFLSGLPWQGGGAPLQTIKTVKTVQPVQSAPPRHDNASVPPAPKPQSGSPQTIAALLSQVPWDQAAPASSTHKTIKSEVKPESVRPPVRVPTVSSSSSWQIPVRDNLGAVLPETPPKPNPKVLSSLWDAPQTSNNLSNKETLVLSSIWEVPVQKTTGAAVSTEENRLASYLSRPVRNFFPTLRWNG